MLVRAYCDIDRAGEQGIERFPAAFEIGHCDGKSVVAEVAAPFHDRHRQIIEMRLIGDSELERGAFKLLSVGQTERDPAEQQVCHTRGEGPTVVVQFYHGATEELQHLPSIALFRPSWQSQNPYDAKSARYRLTVCASPWAWPRERSCAHATHPLALLRACRERPRDRRVAEKRYELAAF